MQFASDYNFGSKEKGDAALAGRGPSACRFLSTDQVEDVTAVISRLPLRGGNPTR